LTLNIFGSFVTQASRRELGRASRFAQDFQPPSIHFGSHIQGRVHGQARFSLFDMQ
jgi:hypothetical protein